MVGGGADGGREGGADGRREGDTLGASKAAAGVGLAKQSVQPTASNGKHVETLTKAWLKILVLPRLTWIIPLLQCTAGCRRQVNHLAPVRRQRQSRCCCCGL